MAALSLASKDLARVPTLDADTEVDALLDAEIDAVFARALRW